MSYNCKPCGFSTANKYDFEKHKSTNKHKLRITIQQKNEQEKMPDDKKYFCFDCKLPLSENEMKNHAEMCIVRNLKKRIEELEKNLEKEKLVAKEKLIAKEEVVQILKKDQEDHAQTIHDLSRTTSNATSMASNIATGAFKFINTYYNKAPPLI